jgi:hypothetical protein
MIGVSGHTQPASRLWSPRDRGLIGTWPPALINPRIDKSLVLLLRLGGSRGSRALENLNGAYVAMVSCL